MTPQHSNQAPPLVEAQNPFDQYGDVAASTTQPQYPSIVGRSSSFDPTNQRRGSMPLAQAAHQQHQQQQHAPPPAWHSAKGVFRADGTNGASAAHPLTGSAAPHPLTGGFVERMNPFDEFSTAPPSPLSQQRGHRPPQGHRATKSLCLPSDFSALMAPPAPVAAPLTPNAIPQNGSMNAEASAALKDLAASLSQAKPRALNDAEKAEESKMLARVSLGEQPKESTGTKKSHRRKASMESFRMQVKGAVKDSIHVMKDPRTIKEIANRHHKKGSSMDANDMSNIVNEINDAGGGTKAKESSKSGLLGSLSMTPKTIAKRKSMDHKKIPNVPLTPGTPKDKNAKGNGRTSTASTPARSPGIMSTPGSVASKKGVDNGLGGSLDDSPVERGTLSTIFSGLPGGDESARHLMTTAPPLPPLDVPDLAGNGLTSPPLNPTVMATPGGTFASACSYATTSDVPAMRSSETDPAPHQVEISPADDFLVHAKTCAVMDSYRVVDQNFDFGALVGMSRIGLEGFVNPVSVDDDDDEDVSGAGNVRSDRGKATDGAMLVETAHRPIVSSVLGCSDDIVVEGFFHELGGAGDKSRNNSDHGPAHSSRKKAEDDTGTGRDKATDDRVEAAIFYSHRRRQFVVTWRGTTADQAKPVRNRHLRAWKEKWDKIGKGTSAKDLCNLASVDGKDCTVFPPYLDSYMESGLENRVFQLLDELCDRRPFCDVVMTGHSFGAALATLAAVRYASSHPMMRVLCQAFGCPRVGDEAFARHWANSLPNLRIMRVEYGADPWVCSPEGAPWTHAGHSIVVDADALKEKSDATGLESKSSERGKSMRSSDKAIPVRAYRFDKHRSGSDGAGWLDWAGSMGVHHHHHSGKDKADHELRSYVNALELIASMGLHWPRDYVGEDVGKGVKGSGKEKRLVV